MVNAWLALVCGLAVLYFGAQALVRGGAPRLRLRLTGLGKTALVIGGLGLLMLGSHLFVQGAVRLAETWGMSQVAIGLTIVAVGHGPAGVAASLVATVKKEDDVAIGNVIGSEHLQRPRQSRGRGVGEADRRARSRMGRPGPHARRADRRAAHIAWTGGAAAAVSLMLDFFRHAIKYIAAAPAPPPTAESRK